MKEIFTNKLIRTACCLSLIFLFSCAIQFNGSKKRNAETKCKESSKAFAPARAEYSTCQTEGRDCAKEKSQMIEIGVSALEKCGNFNPEAACQAFGSTREVCENPAQCERAKNAFDKYCNKPGN